MPKAPYGPLKVEYRPIAKLAPNPANPRAHPPKQIDKIAASLTRFGWTNPILVDGENGVIAGHGRLQAAKQLGQQRVPVIELQGLSTAEKRAYLLADNRIAQEAGWDNDLLAVEFGALKDMGLDLSLTGFDSGEIGEILNPSPGPLSEPPSTAPRKPAVSRKGDIWDMGDHRLACGHAQDRALLMKLMAGRKAHCVFTDPPYGVSYEARSGQFEMIKGDDLRRGQLYDDLHGAFAALLEHTREDAGWYVWHASATREDFAKALRDTGLVELGILIWAKPGQVLGWSDYGWAHEPCFYCARQGVKPAFYGERTETTIWRVAARSAKNEAHAAIGSGIVLTTPDGEELYVQSGAPKGKKVRHVHHQDTTLLSPSGGEADDLWEVSRETGHGKEAIHPNQKPVELARRALRNSTREGELVVDIYAGSGSTLIAADQLGRMCYAVDLDPGYVDAAVRRWQTLTGKAATLNGQTFEQVAKARSRHETADRQDPPAKKAPGKAKASSKGKAGGKAKAPARAA